ncbi:MAG: hypothetical protein JWP27_1370 [Flaviaesturariibacter sp.]|nr:hypothetical protein [Flaviaesturariibacter sp.]
MKKAFLLGLVSGLLAGITAIAYQRVYGASLGADFKTILTPALLLAAGAFAGILAATLYTALISVLKKRGELAFNFLFTILSFGSILAAFAIKLPLDMEAPELFPGLAVPMLFFPALAWHTLKPLLNLGYEDRKRAAKL